jgi:4-amino-4-deoxychorismate lyase
MIEVLINGVRPAAAAHALDAADRGLHYGDGLFETMLLSKGRVPLLSDHLQRLAHGCVRLALPGPDLRVLEQEIQRICGAARDGVVKLVLTRGAAGRGYAPAPTASLTRMIALYPPVAASSFEVTVRWCGIRLGRNPHLAGIKHLNRLEQVLAQAEPAAAGADEGLLLDSAGEVVSAVSSNLFLVRDGALCTSDLQQCGVKGVMRGRVLRIATAAGIVVREGALCPQDVERADEVFLTNAVRGLRPVVALEARRWKVGPVTLQLHGELQRQLD